MTQSHLCFKKQTLTLYAMEMDGRNLTGHRETRKEGFAVVYEGDCACLSATETDEEE